MPRDLFPRRGLGEAAQAQALRGRIHEIDERSDAVPPADTGFIDPLAKSDRRT